MYIWARLAAQLRSGLPIVLYLLAVQVIVLRTPVQDWPQILGGVVLVIIGLAAFLEGLMLAIMPVGELCGLSLPRPRRLVFCSSSSSWGSWRRPLSLYRRAPAHRRARHALMSTLFALLGHRSLLLVIAIGAGVGIAFSWESCASPLSVADAAPGVGRRHHDPRKIRAESTPLCGLA